MCSDGYFRIWSQNSSRWFSQQVSTIASPLGVFNFLVKAPYFFVKSDVIYLTLIKQAIDCRNWLCNGCSDGSGNYMVLLPNFCHNLVLFNNQCGIAVMREVLSTLFYNRLLHMIHSSRVLGAVKWRREGKWKDQRTCGRWKPLRKPFPRTRRSWQRFRRTRARPWEPSLQRHSMTEVWSGEHMTCRVYNFAAQPDRILTIAAWILSGFTSRPVLPWGVIFKSLSSIVRELQCFDMLLCSQIIGSN